MSIEKHPIMGAFLVCLISFLRVKKKAFFSSFSKRKEKENLKKTN